MITQCVLPIEEAVSTISGIDELRVRATEANAQVTIQFVLERKIEEAAQDVREKVAGAIRELPPNVLPPVIQKAGSPIPIPWYRSPSPASAAFARRRRLPTNRSSASLRLSMASARLI